MAVAVSRGGRLITSKGRNQSIFTDSVWLMEGSMSIFNTAMEDVASACGYESAVAYNDACRQPNPEVVQERLANLVEVTK